MSNKDKRVAKKKKGKVIMLEVICKCNVIGITLEIADLGNVEEEFSEGTLTSINEKKCL